MKITKIVTLSLIVSLLIVSLLIVNSAQAWRLTPELREEIASKEAAVNKNPDDPHAYFDLAITYAYTNHIQNGWARLKKVEEMDPEFRKKGLDLYLKKVTGDPDNWRLRFRLAFAYYFNHGKKEAIRELKNVLIIDPYNIWAYGYIALIYGEMGDVDSAMEYTRKGLKIDSNVAALHLLLAEGYYKKGDGWRGFLERLEALRLKALGY
jgi:tetratricopeptide (TPR) repeat protein